MQSQPRKQLGQALILMMAIIALGASWWLIDALAKASTNRTSIEASKNARVLAHAKSALLGYVAQQAAVSSERHPGRLPCPEAPGSQNNHDGTKYVDDDDGTAAGSCSLPAIGRLPWRTLGIDKPLDAFGQPLWYVVSPGWAFPFPGAVPVINSNTLGQLTLDGQAAVALIIAPGRPMSVPACAGLAAKNQIRARQPNVDWEHGDFLECDNATSPADATFTMTGPRDSFNDQLIAVTAKEIWTHAEASVAVRIKRDVVPQLQAVYNTARWGATSTSPIFPFAANFANFTDASTFAFQGEVPRPDGLLPATFGQCTPGSDPRCDPSFVQWNVGASAVTMVKRSGTADVTNLNCSASTGNQASCNITYERTCGGLGCLLGCACNATLEASLLASAPNVGRALRSYNPAVISGFSSLAPQSTPLDSTGAAIADIRGDLPSDSCTAWLILGVLFPCTASRTVTVNVPISVFADHPLVNPNPPPTEDAWYWFITNNWHHVTYYAVAPSHLPSGLVHNCSSAFDCLTVSGGSPSSDIQAILALAGRSLTGTPRPSGNLVDFLDSAENQDTGSAYEQKRVDGSFNDRVVTVGNY